MSRFVGLIGMVLLLGIAYLFSVDRKSIQWRTVLSGILLQFFFALFILKFDVGHRALGAAASAFTRLVGFAGEGSRFVFGALATDPENFVFAFTVLPIVIFFSSLFTVLYYLGLMQLIVLGTARLMTRLMHVSGSESLAAAANIFVGQTEAPIMVAPYIREMTRSELMALMTGGMATVAGSILGGYIGLGINAQYLIGASVMSAPAALVMAKLIIPETEISKTAGEVTLEVEREDANIIDAAARGAGQGAILAINIAAMLIAFIALIHLVNFVLTGIGSLSGFEASFGTPLTMQFLLGSLFAPVAFLMGVPWGDASAVGQLMGIKIVVNEFVAYVDLAALRETLDPRSELIATYALCGFANLGSIGIQIGGIGGLAPDRKAELAQLGLRAVLGGALASFMTATLAGMLY